jgi:hypothetical protein
MSITVCLEQDGLIGFVEYKRAQGGNFDYDSYNVHIWTLQAWKNSRIPPDVLWRMDKIPPRWPLLFKSFGNQKMAEDYLLDKMAYSSFLLLSMSYNT